MAGRFYQPLLIKYLSNPRIYAYKGIRVHVAPGVFHPGFFFSTRLLLRYLGHQPLAGRSFLELGAGSGLISLYAARKGAVVTATDINPLAISCLERNRTINGVSIDIIHSDLFHRIPPQPFDILAVNPPYYPKQPANDAERAWYCGENGEYFDGFFGGLARYIHHRSDVWMVLCDGCDLNMIRRLAGRHGWALRTVYIANNLLERNFIFKIEPLTKAGAAGGGSSDRTDIGSLPRMR
jgi:release factor glutamine methyltransferase